MWHPCPSLVLSRSRPLGRAHEAEPLRVYEWCCSRPRITQLQHQRGLASQVECVRVLISLLIFSGLRDGRSTGYIQQQARGRTRHTFVSPPINQTTPGKPGQGKGEGRNDTFLLLFYFGVMGFFEEEGGRMDGQAAMDRRCWDAKEGRREGLLTSCVCVVFSLVFFWPRPVFFFSSSFLVRFPRAVV